MMKNRILDCYKEGEKNPQRMTDHGYGQYVSAEECISENWLEDNTAEIVPWAGHRTDIFEVAGLLKIEDLELRTKRLERYSGTGVICIPLTTFNPQPYEIIGTVTVVVKPSDDEFLGSFYDANIHTGGDTEQEAYDNVKSLMISLYNKLNSFEA
jgi:hypothetical protein